MHILTAVIRVALILIVTLGGLAVISAVIMNECGMVDWANGEEEDDA